MTIDLKTVKHISKLSRISLEDKKAEKLASDLNSIFSFIEKLNELDASKIEGEMYFGCAETDDWAPPEMVQGLDDYLSKTGINYRIEWYPKTHHGFVFPLREGMYHKDSAERHWERIFDLFRRNLR